MRTKLIRGFGLILILCFVVIIFSPSSKVSANCTSGSGIKVDNGLISTYSTGSFEAGSGVSCIESSRAVIPQFALTTYSEMKTLYYNQANTSISKTKFDGNQIQDNSHQPISLLNSDSNKLYWITGNLIIDKDINDKKKTGVIFIDGNLFINDKLSKNSDTTGLVFIVQGTIYIAPSVTEINAFMIAYGSNPGNTMPFCSAYQGSDPYSCKDVADPNQQKQLTIYGSVISLNSATAPQFVRQKSDLITAAETINYEPKYLVILKDIFSRDLKIWQEVQ